MLALARHPAWTQLPPPKPKGDVTTSLECVVPRIGSNIAGKRSLAGHMTGAPCTMPCIAHHASFGDIDTGSIVSVGGRWGQGSDRTLGPGHITMLGSFPVSCLAAPTVVVEAPVYSIVASVATLLGSGSSSGWGGHAEGGSTIGAWGTVQVHKRKLQDRAA